MDVLWTLWMNDSRDFLWSYGSWVNESIGDSRGEKIHDSQNLTFPSFVFSPIESTSQKTENKERVDSRGWENRHEGFREKRRMHYESMLMPGGSFMSSMDSVIDEQVHKVETQWKKLGPANHIVLWGWSCLSLGILCRVDQPIEHSLSYFFFLGSANAQWKEGLGKRLHSRGQGIWRRLWPCFTFLSLSSSSRMKSKKKQKQRLELLMKDKEIFNYSFKGRFDR